MRCASLSALMDNALFARGGSMALRRLMLPDSDTLRVEESGAVTCRDRQALFVNRNRSTARDFQITPSGSAFEDLDSRPIRDNLA
jgi:hypothetical protein